MKANFIALVLTGLFIVSFTWAAQPRISQRGMPPDLSMLNLSKDQKDQITDLRLNLQKEIIPLHSEMEKLRSELKIAVTSDPFDKVNVEKIVTIMADLHKEINMKRIMNQHAIRDLLTAEQRKKYDLFILSRDGRGERDKQDFDHRGPRMPAKPKGEE